jgi:hypothetical protein
MGVWSVHSSFDPGAVAQLGERRLCTAEVRGSNPLGSTPKIRRFAGKNDGTKNRLKTHFCRCAAIVQQRGGGMRYRISSVVASRAR